MRGYYTSVHPSKSTHLSIIVIVIVVVVVFVIVTVVDLLASIMTGF